MNPNNGASIFRVPESVTQTNPTAYAPHQMGLGPYHHFLPDVPDMKYRKTQAAKELLGRKQFLNLKSLIVEKLKGIEPGIRSCYYKDLNLDSDALAEIMAMDGVYLLHLLSKYANQKKKKNADHYDRLLAEDMLMLENQLPCVVLKEIMTAVSSLDENITLQKAGGNNNENNYEELYSGMLSFCRAHSPLQLTQDAEVVNYIDNPHLLSYLYNLITLNWVSERKMLYNTGKKTRQGSGGGGDGYVTVEGILDAGKLIADISGNEKLLQFLTDLPVKQVLDFFDKIGYSTEKTPFRVEEINIPSAYQLQKKSKVEFEVWRPADSSGKKTGGIGIKYVAEDRKLLLPEITVNTDTEVILRNLVAYEVAYSSNSVISGYVDFMCALTDTIEDVKLLMEKGIIKSDLPAPEVLKVFNGISKSNRMRTDLEETIDKLNLIYNGHVNVPKFKSKL